MAIDLAARAVLVEAAMTTEDGGKPEYDAAAVEAVLRAQPEQCMLGTAELAPPFLMACSYGAIDLVKAMVEIGGVDAARAADAHEVGRRSALMLAVSIDCDGEGSVDSGDLRARRMLGQSCCDFGGQCGGRCYFDDGLFCILLGEEQKRGKLAVIEYLATLCDDKEKAAACAAAKEILSGFEKDLEYNIQNAVDNHGADLSEEEDDGMDEDELREMIQADDQDCGVAAENVDFADNMVGLLENNGGGGGGGGGGVKSAAPATSAAPAAKKAKKAPKQRCTPISAVPNFGGRRCGADGPTSVQSWAPWDCDPEDASGRAPTQKHGYGKTFPWHFDMLEKAYILVGSATLTADDEAAHGPPITIKAKDMVTFPKGWRGTWVVHSLLRKRYAFFDGSGIRVDESDDDEEDGGE